MDDVWLSVRAGTLQALDGAAKMRRGPEQSGGDARPFPPNTPPEEDASGRRRRFWRPLPKTAASVNAAPLPRARERHCRRAPPPHESDRWIRLANWGTAARYFQPRRTAALTRQGQATDEPPLRQDGALPVRQEAVRMRRRLNRPATPGSNGYAGSNIDRRTTCAGLKRSTEPHATRRLSCHFIRLFHRAVSTSPTPPTSGDHRWPHRSGDVSADVPRNRAGGDAPDNLPGRTPARLRRSAIRSPAGTRRLLAEGRMEPGDRRLNQTTMTRTVTGVWRARCRRTCRQSDPALVSGYHQRRRQRQAMPLFTAHFRS